MTKFLEHYGELCDECGEPLGNNPIFDDHEMTQFCSEQCQYAWAEDD